MIDYKALAKRLEMHAECHAHVEPHDDEQRQWAADLRTVVSLLDEMADMEPAARIYTDAELVHRDPRWGRVCWIVPECEIDGGALLYLHPAPQPQPEPAPEGAPYGIIDPDYGRAYTIARKLAWEEGYAIGLHGSFTRDLDMIAVPWADTACEPEHLIRRIAEAAGLRIREGVGVKPHGRLAWTLFFPAFGDPRFVDLSVMPRVLADEQPQPERQPVSDPCIGNDPNCPCQDGDPCHYRDHGDTKAMPIPQPQPVSDLAPDPYPDEPEWEAPVEPTEAQIEARDALLDFISENGTTSEGVQHYLDRYVRAALAAKTMQEQPK